MDRRLVSQYVLRKRCDTVNSGYDLPYRAVITPDFTSGAWRVILWLVQIRGMSFGGLRFIF